MAPALDPKTRPYRPYGAAEQLLYCRMPEVLLSGPAGTGKSRACLEKLFICAEKYAGMRGLIVRKTRASCTQSVMVTWEDKVVPDGHACLSGATRMNREAYRFANDSEIAVGGMDKASRIMSTEWDMVYVPEATELAEEEWEALTSRLRNGKMPYQQLLADCNPDKPSHWLKRRADAGSTKLIESRHEDNPLLYDHRRRDWTPEGLRYLGLLDRLTGPRKLRLRDGRWVQAEGVVYDGWDAAVHLVDRVPIPNDWPRVRAIDFGYRNPFVCQWWAVDADGRLWLYREIYFTGRLVEDHARRIAELERDDPRPVVTVCDHDAEDRATLERHLGCQTVAANKAKGPGIQGVQARLRRQGDGKPRLFILRDSLNERDPELDAAKKPCCTAEEFDGYVWDTRGGRKTGEEPVKENDHGLDALRYCVWGMDCDGEVAAPEPMILRA